jgi:predicted permease
MRDLRLDLRSGLRQLARRPGFAVVVVALLALGIGASVTVFALVEALLLRPLPYEHADRLVRLHGSNPERGWDSFGVSSPDLLDLRARATLLDALGAYHYAEANLATERGAERVDALWVTPGIFELVGASPQLGRTFAADEAPAGRNRVIVLGHGFWLRRFGGDPDVVGRRVHADGEELEVIGVMPAGFFLPVADLAYWRPFDVVSDPSGRGARWLSVIGRTAPGVSAKQAQEELRALAAALESEHPETNDGWTMTARGARDWIAGDARSVVLLLWAAVSAVLLVACANVATLMLARAGARRAEMATRAALGASRARLVRLVVVESLVLALLGGALGFVLGQVVIDRLQSLPGSTVPDGVELRLDGRLLLFAWGVALFAALLASLAPALRTARVDLQSTIKTGSAKGSAGRDPLRAALVAAQVALAVLVLIGSALVLRSFLALSRTETGLRTESVLTLQVPLPASRYDSDEKIRAFYAQLLDRVAALPGVEQTGAINLLPLQNWGYNGNFEVEGYEPKSVSDAPFAEFRVVSSGYFAALGVPLLDGRMPREDAPLAGDDAAFAGEVLVNRRLAERHWPGESAVGKRVGFGDGNWLTVAGVVGDVRNVGLQREVSPEMYLPLAASPSPSMSLVLRTSVAPETLAGAVRAAVHEIDPDQPVAQVQTMQQVVSSYLSDSRFNSLLLGLFGLLSLLLAMAGVFGFLSYIVSQRTRELGLRVALGARQRDVVRLVLRQTLVLAGSGALLGVLAAMGLTRFLEGQLHGVEPIDPLSFGVVVIGLLGVSIIASWVPARRAARVDPMTTLRAE